MWVNAMSRVARQKGITIPELLKQPREKSPSLTCLPKPLKSRPNKVNTFEGLSTRELYFRRPMDFAEYAASLTVGSLLAANPLTLTIAVLLLARSRHVGQKKTTTSKLMNRFGWGGKAGAFIKAASLASGAWVGVAAGLTAAVIVSHLQKRVGDKEDAYDREHMVQEMQALVDRRVAPLLETPK